jgi:DNA polymerase III sliding clamp (beta) subunit (PCNA family)
MKIEVSKTDLKNALSSVNVALDRNSKDIFGHYLFRMNGDRVEILTHHKAFCASAFLNCLVTGSKEGECFTVEGSRFQQWIEAIPDTVITLDFDPEQSLMVASVDSDDFQTTMEFGVMEPELFSFWDDQLEEATLKATFEDSRRLASAISSAKAFALDKVEGSQNLGYTNIEVREGSIWASDSVNAIMVNHPSLKDCSFRMHSTALNNALKVLKKDQSVVVKEQDKVTFFVFQDESCFGVVKTTNALPSIRVDKTIPKAFSLTFSVDLLKRSIGTLVSGASDTNNKLGLSWLESSSVVTLSMASVNGKEQKAHIKVVKSSIGDGPDDSIFPKSVILNQEVLMKILSEWSGGEIEIEFVLSKKANSGYCRFSDTREDLDVFIVTPWMKR